MPKAPKTAHCRCETILSPQMEYVPGVHHDQHCGMRLHLIPCGCHIDAEGNLIPDRGCEIHWHQVIDGADLPPEMYP